MYFVSNIINNTNNIIELYLVKWYMYYFLVNKGHVFFIIMVCEAFFLCGVRKKEMCGCGKGRKLK